MQNSDKNDFKLMYVKIQVVLVVISPASPSLWSLGCTWRAWTQTSVWDLMSQQLILYCH